MEWVATTLTLPWNVVYPALLTLMHTTRLSAVNRTDAPADLNGFVHFGERRNLVSVRVPSRFKCSLLLVVDHIVVVEKYINIFELKCIFVRAGTLHSLSIEAVYSFKLNYQL
jgi:hypothetical protein